MTAKERPSQRTCLAFIISGTMIQLAACEWSVCMCHDMGNHLELRSRRPACMRM